MTWLMVSRCSKVFSLFYPCGDHPTALTEMLGMGDLQKRTGEHDEYDAPGCGKVCKNRMNHISILCGEIFSFGPICFKCGKNRSFGYGFVSSCLYLGLYIIAAPQKNSSKRLRATQVVYYMQIKDQLPSLHRLMEWSEKDYQILNDYAWNFLSLEDAKQAVRNGRRYVFGERPGEVSISWA